MKNYIFGFLAIVLIVYWVITHSLLFVHGGILLAAVVLAFLAGYFTRYTG